MKFYILLLALLFIIPLSAQKKSLGDVLQVNTKKLITLNSAAVSVQSPDLLLFGNIGNNIVNSFKGDNLYLHLRDKLSYFVDNLNPFLDLLERF